MSIEWVSYKIEEIAESMGDAPFGSNLKNSDYQDFGALVIQGKNIQGRSCEWKDRRYVSLEKYIKLRKNQCFPGDLIFPKVGTIGKVGILTPAPGVEHYVLSTNTMRLKVNESLACRDFVYYFFTNPQTADYILAINSNSVQPVFNYTSLKNFLIKLPPVYVQRKIGALLRSLDDRITLLRETNATLEALAQSLFKSWFVDFDPVHTKSKEFEPEGMDAATAAMFPDCFEESELGVVPKGWKLVPFGELLIHTIGGDWGDEAPSEKNDTRVAIIRGTDIPDLHSGSANRVPLRYTSSKKLATRKLQDGDLVLEVSGGSRDQPTGRSLYLTDALLGQFDCPVEPASFCRLLRPSDKHIGLLLARHLTYIYGIGKTWEYQNQSTGIANFQTTHFLESELVAVPPREVLAVFVDIVRSIVDRGHLSQISNLESLRDTLLPRLISGQLPLPEGEVVVEDACA
ncbi:restriction endonuclease subunit S [Pseudomonas migulae]